MLRVVLVIIIAIDAEEILPKASTALAVNVFVHSNNTTPMENHPVEFPLAITVTPL